ncbi:MAG: flagellar export protein FliJ [Gammaproteobacteria bacterium]|nr:flagellar export protein FliJ [Gammaproteobacteria bacterium]
MTRLERLDPAVKHADKKEQAALKQVAAAQSEVNIEQNKLSQLKDYRDEYINRRDRMQASHSVIELQEFNRFLSQLDDTIKKQMSVIKLRQSQLDEQRSQWLKTQINSKVIHQVVKNLSQEEIVKQARSEQKAMDEFSLRKSQNR